MMQSEQKDDFLDLLDEFTEDNTNIMNDDMPNNEENNEVNDVFNSLNDMNHDIKNDFNDNNVNNNNTKNNNNNNNHSNNETKKDYGYVQVFYTNTSALGIKCQGKNIFFEIAHANKGNSGNNRTYDWKNKAVVKMNIDELCMLKACLERYVLYGEKGFLNIATFLQPNNKQQGILNFYHESKNAISTIALLLNKNKIPVLYINRNKEKYGFYILPSFIFAFIEVLNTYIRKVILTK